MVDCRERQVLFSEVDEGSSDFIHPLFIGDAFSLAVVSEK